MYSTTTFLSAIALGAALIINSADLKAQSWALTGNPTATNTSKLGATATNINLGLWAGNLERIRILGSNGNVGIGNTAPTSKLHVTGSIAAAGGTSTTWNFASRVSGTFSSGRIPRYNGTAFINGSIYDNGSRIGIGTSTSVTKLQIIGGVDASLDGDGYIVLGDTSGTNLVIDNNEIMVRNNNAGASLYLNHDGGNIYIAGQGLGKVGIGTTSPAHKLDVCGTIRAEEIRVETGWCDYVFADEYKLTPLSDVENFIKANKHLPDVTPGNIIEAEGLEVGKVSAQMIKKIEELTLYVIELQKQVDELKKAK